MNKILMKLSSRKLWLAISGVVTGVALALGVETTEIGEIAGAVTALISVVTYIVVEGKVDAEAVKNTIIEIQDGIDILEGVDEE